MIDAPDSAASAFAALRAGMDTAANNLANANTPGFKSTRLILSELAPSARSLVDAQGPDGLSAVRVGSGVRVAGVRLDMSQGSAVSTGRDLDMISGQGFFRTLLSERPGGIAYTRCGHLALNADGDLIIASDRGIVIEPPITIPADAVPPIRITCDGHVQVMLAGLTVPQEVGQLELATFVNPEGLLPIGDQLFVETACSGSPSIGSPQTDNRGSICQNFLESSNVSPELERLTYQHLSRLYQAWSAMTGDESPSGPSPRVVSTAH